MGETKIDTAELRRLAEAATPGEWEWWTSCSFYRMGVKHDYPNHILEPTVLSDGHPDIICEPEDRAYIAAASPSVLLALLSRLEAAERVVEAASAMLGKGEYCVTSRNPHHHNAHHDSRQALRAAIREAKRADPKAYEPVYICGLCDKRHDGVHDDCPNPLPEAQK